MKIFLSRSSCSPSIVAAGCLFSKFLTAACTSLLLGLVVLIPKSTTLGDGILLVTARYVTSASNELHHQQNERMAMPMQYEAEDGVLIAASVATNHDGFSGNGFVDYGGAGSFTSWSIDVPATGNYDVTVRYASANSRPLLLLLNDNVVEGGQFVIPTTNAWTNWQTETITVNLTAGIGQVLKIVAAENPGPNVDYVILEAVNTGGGGSGISDDFGVPRNTPPPTPAPTTGAGGGGGGDGQKLHVVLTTSQRVGRNSFTKSENGLFEVGLDNTGDLIIRGVASGTVLWSLSAEVGQPIGGHAMWMQNDGNLVIRGEPTDTKPSGPAVWTSGTVGSLDSYHFTIDNSGGIAVVLLFQNNRIVWRGGLSNIPPQTSNPRNTPLTSFPTPSPVLSPPTPASGPPSMPPDMPAAAVLRSNQSLNRNAFTFSPNGVYSVGIDNGGRFVLRMNGNEIWQLLSEEGDVIRGVDRAFMQSDGNLVFRSNSRPGALWNSETSNNPGAELYVDNGGRVSIVYLGTALWMDGVARGSYLRGLPSSRNLSFPIRGFFYYAWYPETWQVNGKDVFYVPNLKGIQPGFYKSGDPTAISAHVKALDYAWADLGIISWFGPRHRLDKARITQLMDETVAQGSSIKWTVYHEDERNRDASVDELVADLEYLEEWFAWHPAFAHIDGKPIILVYNEAGCEVAERWRQAADRTGWYVNLKLFPGFRNCNNQPEAWHQYGVGNGILDYPECTCIAPGFWRSDKSQPSYPRVGREDFCQQVETMIQNNRDWQLIVSFNEWGEGTAVESSTEWDSSSGYGQYLDCLHDPQL